MKKIKYTTKLMMATSLLSLLTIGTVNAKDMNNCKNQMNTDCMQEMKSDSMQMKDKMMKSEPMQKDEVMKSEPMKTSSM